MARGSIRRRGDSYQIIVELGIGADGKRLRRYLSASTKREAEALLSQYQHQADSGQLAADARMSLGQFVGVWLRDHVAAHCSERTGHTYAGLCQRHILPFLGDVSLAKLSPGDIARWLTQLRQAQRQDGSGPLKPTTVHASYRCLKACLNVAVRWGYIPFSPASRVGAPKVPKEPMKVLDVTQAQTFLASAGEEPMKWRAFFTTLLLAGCRPGELKAARWTDLDLETGTLRLQRTAARVGTLGVLEGSTKTSTGRRPIALGGELVALLRRHKAEQNAERLRAGSLWQDNDLVFPSEVGTFLEDKPIRRAFRRILERAGLPSFRLYDLRHTSASLALAAGTNPKVVSERLGHTSVGFTLSVYSHVLPHLQKEAADVLEAALLRKAK